MSPAGPSIITSRTSRIVAPISANDPPGVAATCCINHSAPARVLRAAR